MKQLLSNIIISLSLITCSLQLTAQDTFQIQNTLGDTLFEVRGEGILVPKVTTAERTAATSNLTLQTSGLLAYDTDTQSFWVWNGAAWASLMPSTGGTLQGTGGNTYNIRAANDGAGGPPSFPDAPIAAGNIRGRYSVDLQTIRGLPTEVAKGFAAVISGGERNTASETYSTVGGGNSNTASAISATIAGGVNNIASNDYATVIGGLGNIASGKISLSAGRQNFSPSFGETVLGIFSTTYAHNSSDTFNASDRLFSVGNGTGFFDRSNALTILKNGNVGIGPDNPAVKLEVDGTVQATTFVGDGSGLTGITITEVDGDITNEIQDLQLVGNNLTITNNGNATTIDLSPYLDNTDTQLTEAQVDVFVENNGYLTAEVDGDPTNEIELPIGGTQGQVLSTDGAGNYSWTDDVGGTILGSNGHIRAANATGNTRGEYAVDLQTIRLAPTQVASGRGAVIGGGENNTASKLGSTVSGGTFNLASGNHATIAGGEFNLASGNHATIAGGALNAAIGDYSSVVGGIENTAPSYAETVLGLFNTNYTPNDSIDFNANDRIFVVGNGTSTTNRSNALTILKNGNVGIGPDVPTEALEVDGTVKATTFVGDGSGLTGIITDNLGNHTATQNIQLGSNWLSFEGQDEGIQVNADGKIDIQGSNPNLEFYGAEETNGRNFASISTVLPPPPPLSSTNNTIQTLKMEFKVGTDNVMTLYSRQGSKRVGIGTSNPNAPLHVQGTTTINSFSGPNNGGSFLARGSADTNPLFGQIAPAISAGSTDVSIYASGSIVADGEGVFVGATVNFSDKRIKEVEGISDVTADTKMLQAIEVTDYRRIDGGKHEKKVIAQQLREVFPQAVSFRAGVIPCIYEHINQFDLEAKTNLLTVNTTKEHDLQVGDLIDYYTEADKFSKQEIVAVLSPTSFQVKTANKPTELFIYGKWVNDMHVVDYDAISMLNVSVTQEQQRIIEEQQATLKAQQAEIELLKAQIGQFNELKAMVEELKAKMSN